MKLRSLPRTALDITRLPKAKAAIAARGQRDAVFLWIPKTAGTSLYDVLAAHGCPKLKRLPWVRRRFSQRGFVTFGHLSYVQLLTEGHVSEAFDKRSFKFAFVRNPWDRAVSLYHYLQTTRKVGPDEDFESFLRRVADGVPAIGLIHVRGLSQCNPQIAWLRGSDDKLIADFLGRYESLGDDFRTICGELGITGALSRLNPSPNRRFYTGYYTAETRHLVEKIYAEDIDRFEYRFA